MTKTRPLPEDNIAILAYGSLLTEPAKVMKPHLLGAIEQITPFGVEYARSSRSRGGAPTLVKYENAEPVSGRLLVLDQAESAVEEVKRWLWEREGRPQWSAIKVIRIGGRLVVYADLEPNIPERYLSAPILAELAIGSVPLAEDRNGIRYLADNLSSGIRTRLTPEYEQV